MPHNGGGYQHRDGHGADHHDYHGVDNHHVVDNRHGDEDGGEDVLFSHLLFKVEHRKSIYFY